MQNALCIPIKKGSTKPNLGSMRSDTRRLHGAITKTTAKAMKLTALIMIGFCLHVGAKTLSQEITFSGKDVPLKKVFSIIKEQTGFFVFYNKELLKSTTPISVSATKVPLNQFIETILKDQPLNYALEGNTVVITRKSPTPGLNPGLGSPEAFKPQLLPPPITVRGRILNENNEPVIASVTIKGTKRGTTSDGEGFFTLNNVDDNAELIISATNIETVITHVNAKETLNITVTMTSSSLNEVIVNKGYYTETQRRSTGSIVRVDAKDIENQPVTSPLLALQGRMPGVEIMPTSGTPGSAVSIRIRGLNSLRNDGINGNLPLYIIDGIPISSIPIASRSESASTRLIDRYDPLSTINPANIESIQILKDADATAIYGSRGANGVVLITTKNKKSAQGLNTDAGFYRGTGKIVNRVEMLSRMDYLMMRREAFKNDNVEMNEFNASDFMIWDTTRNVDWQKEILEHQSNITDVQLNVAGGTGRTSIGFGGSYHKETLMYPGDYGYSRYSGNLTLNHSSYDDRFHVAITATYGVDNLKLFDNSLLLSSSLALPPAAPKPFNNDGTLNWEPIFGFETFNNPWANLKTTHVSSAHNLITSGLINYNLSHGFLLSTQLGFSRYDHDESIKIPITSLSPYSYGALEGKSIATNDQRTFWSIEPQLNYKKQFGDHSINSLLGVSLQHMGSEIESLKASGYKSDAMLGTFAGAGKIESQAAGDVAYHYIAGFIRLGYDYKGKYLVNLTGRRDGSSRFGPGKRYGDFGAFGVGWIFSEEKLLANNSSVLSFGKIRASYGITGNDQIGDSKFFRTYRPSGVYHNSRGLVPASLFNPDYAWEKTKKLEAAVELGFLNDRISFTIAHFRNRSSNQLVNYQLPAVTGFTDVFTNFNATVENTGWEYSLTTRNITTKIFTWTTTFNTSVLKNKLVAFPGIEESGYATVFKVGAPITLKYGYLWLGVDPATGLHTFKDINNSGTITAADQDFLTPLATKYFGGISNTFTFGGFTLDFLFQMADRDAQVLYESLPGDKANQPKYVLNRWQKPGDITTVQRFGTQEGDAGYTYDNFSRSDANIQRIAFVRLKTLAFSYSAPTEFVKRIGLKNAKIFLQGQNLLTITDFDGWDPETIYGAPPLKIISGGIQIKF